MFRGLVPLNFGRFSAAYIRLHQQQEHYVYSFVLLSITRVLSYTTIARAGGVVVTHLRYCEECVSSNHRVATAY